MKFAFSQYGLFLLFVLIVNGYSLRRKFVRNRNPSLLDSIESGHLPFHSFCFWQPNLRNKRTALNVYGATGEDFQQESTDYTNFLKKHACVDTPGVEAAPFNVLAIETSCDDTCAAVLTSDGKVLAHERQTQGDAIEKHGGIVPNTARELHGQRIDNVICSALINSGVPIDEIQRIAVTRGPGLELCLRIGYDAALKLSRNHNIELSSENHIAAHCLSPMLKDCQIEYTLDASGGKSGIAATPSQDLKYPYLCLLLSGGHSQIYIVENPMVYHLLVDTQDQCVGNVLDKCARELGLPLVDGGASALEKAAAKAGYSDYELTVPIQGNSFLTFCFSGIQTQVKELLKNLIAYYGVEAVQKLQPEVLNAVAFSCQQAVFNQVLIQLKRAMWISEALFGINQLVVVGGVACNTRIKARILKVIQNWDGEIANEHKSFIRKQLGFMKKYKHRRPLGQDDYETTGCNPLSESIYDYMQSCKSLKELLYGCLDPNSLAQVLRAYPEMRLSLKQKNEAYRIIHDGYFSLLPLSEFQQKYAKLMSIKDGRDNFNFNIGYPQQSDLEYLAKVPLAPRTLIQDWIKRGMYLRGKWRLFSTTNEYCTDNAVMIGNSLLERHRHVKLIKCKVFYRFGSSRIRHIDKINGKDVCDRWDLAPRLLWEIVSNVCYLQGL